MHKLKLIRHIMGKQPRFNEEICEGICAERMTHAASYIDKIITAASQGFRGVTYEGFDNCTPKEQFTFTVRKRNSTRSFEHAHSDMYMIKTKFKILGKTDFVQPLLIPYVRRGNLLTVRGSTFVASPTYADNMFSVEGGSLFMPVTRNKIKFHRESYRFLADGVDWTADVHHSKMQNLDRSNVPTNRHPLLMNYLFALYGVTGTFKDHLNAEIHYGTEDEITLEKYPIEDWVHCSTLGVPPIARRIELFDARLVVKREDFDRPDIQSAIASFYYMTDYGSERTYLDLDEFDLKDEETGHYTMWLFSLSYFTWKTIDIDLAIRQLIVHLNTVESYLDDLVLARLRNEGLNITSITELFIFIIQNFAAMDIATELSDQSNKYIHVTNVLLFDIVKMISELMFALNKLSGDRLKESNIRKAFIDAYHYDKAMKITSGNKACIDSLDSANDLLLLKATATICGGNKGSSKSKMGDMSNPALKLNATHSLLYTTAFKTKSTPIGNKVNIFLELGPQDKVLVPEAVAPIIDQAAKLLKD